MKVKLNLEDKFLVRESTLKTNVNTTELQNAINFDDLLFILKKNPDIENSIKLANFSFYNELKNYKTKSSKKRKKITKTLFNYLNRSQYRNTPFGLFSQVYLGEFKENDLVNNTNEDDQIQSYVTINNSYTFQLEKRFETNPCTFKNLFLIKSPVVYEEDDKYIVPYRTLYKTAPEEKKIIVNKTEFLSFIINRLKTYISVKELLKDIEAQFSANKEDSLDFLMKLCQNELIFTNMRPAIPFKNHFLELIKNTHGLPMNERNSLKRIEDLVIKANNKEFRYQLDYLSNKITDIFYSDFSINDVSANVLDIDLVNLSEKKLNVAIKQDIEKSLPVLMMFCNLQTENDFFDRIKKIFLEKYSEYDEIPVFKILKDLDEYNKIFGLISNDLELSEGGKKRFEYIMDLINQAVLNHHNEINLSSKDLSTLSILQEDNKLSKSIYDFQFMMTNEFNTIDKSYLFSFVPRSISSGYQAYNGRFLNYFPSMYTDRSTKEQEGTRSYEIISFSNNTKANTVSTNTEKINNLILLDSVPIKGKNNLFVEDLVCGFYADKIYLKKVSNGEIVLPIQTNMMNHEMLFNDLYHFLFLITRQFRIDPNDFFTQLVSQNIRTPSIKYNNIVILKEHWVLKRNLVSPNQKKSLIEKDLKEYFKKNKFPQYLRLSTSYSELTFNIKNELHLGYIADLLKNDDKLIFSKASNEQVIETEYVFQALNPDYFSQELEIISTIRGDSEVNYSNKQEKNSLSYFVYINENNQDEFLKNILFSFKDYCSNNKIRFFIVRFNDDRDHLRIRVLFNSDEDRKRYSGFTDDFFQELLINRHIDKYSINPYYPEINRYGGVEFFKKTEEFFCEQTTGYIELLNNVGRDFNKHLYTIKYLINLVINLGLNYEQISLLFSPYRNSLNKYSRIELKEFEKYVVNPSEYTFREIEKLTGSINLAAYTRQTRPNPFDNYVLSICHMTVNRFIGTSRKSEDKIFHALYTISKAFDSKI